MKNFYTKWLQLDAWTVREAALLLMDHDPDECKSWDLDAPIATGEGSMLFQRVNNVKTLQRTLFRAIEAGTLPYIDSNSGVHQALLSPHELAAFVQENNIDHRGNIFKEIESNPISTTPANENLQKAVDNQNQQPRPSRVELNACKTIAVLAELYAGKIDDGFKKDNSLNVNKIAEAVVQQATNLEEDGEASNITGLSKSAIRDRISIGLSELNK